MSRRDAAIYYRMLTKLYMLRDNSDLALLTAIECIETALRYAAEQRMEPFFYEYCYVTLANLYASTDNPEKAREYHALAVQMDSPDQPEYQSMELKRQLAMARVALHEDDFAACLNHLKVVKRSIDEMDYPSIDALWASGIYFPYLELQSKLELGQQNYLQALLYMDDMFAAGNIYGQTESLLSFLSDENHP